MKQRCMEGQSEEPGIGRELMNAARYDINMVDQVSKNQARPIYMGTVLGKSHGSCRSRRVNRDRTMLLNQA